MNGEISTEVVETVDAAKLRPIRSIRLVAMAFAFFCYVSFAALYFFRPNKPLISLGQLRPLPPPRTLFNDLPGPEVQPLLRNVNLGC